ncbi:MAG TPA: trypsin-like peptidase domain-containing protein [Chitinivibrionales bacterium]
MILFSSLQGKPRGFMSAKAFCCRIASLALLALAFQGPLWADQSAAADSSVKPASGDAVQNSVVKVFATMRMPDLFKPWSKQAPQEVSGSGVIIEGKRILTNAHMVLYANQIQVQANQSGDKVSATVVAVAQGIDLAVLKLDDESFFASHGALARASTLPEIKDAVMTYGFPTGGTGLSITKGIVSRIEFAYYNLSVSGMRIQIDAAINPGNSGGPAVAGNAMIGLAFSRLGGGAENIGYIIPNEEIDLFLKDIADGKYDGKPAISDDFQTLENPALRSYLKLDKSVTGLVVQRVASPESSYPLKVWDVISKIGNTPIDDQGMINVGSNLRVRFQYLVQRIVRNGKVALTVVRSGKTLALEVPVWPLYPTLIEDLQGAYPRYFIFGPMVFSAATNQFLASLNASAGVFAYIGSPLATRRGDKPAFPGEELVVVSSPLFPHALSKGYGSPVALVVKTINGIVIKNLAHLVQTIRDCKDDYIIVNFAGRGGEALVFPRKDMQKATDEILGDNGIRSQGSPDLMNLWVK